MDEELLTDKECESPDHAQRRLPEEKGPFGRSNRRRTSRSRTTVTPSVRTKQDIDAAENWKVIDDIFSRVKSGDEAKDKSVRTPAPGTTAGPDAEGPAAQTTPAGQPTEVILYGFPSAYQYAAIDHYERVSQGIIYEDYDRYPPNGKYNLSLSLGRTHSPANISKEALRKKNRYHGGDHWIKVTFDSAEAAERACHYSPHVIQGHIIYAEPYRGTGPQEDVAIPATEGNVASVTASPSQETSRTLQGVGGTSDTASSATATAVREGPGESASSSATVQAQAPTTLTKRRSARSPLPPTSPPPATPVHAPHSRKEGVKIPGVKGLEPPEKALLPAQSTWQRTFAHLPLIGLFLGGGDLIGNQVPRKEDGSFDWANATLYWWIWAWVDLILRTDFCGLKGDD